MGPTLHDCPVKFLKQSTCQDEYAVAWRKRCYEYREESKKHKQKIEDVYKKLPRGTIIETFGGTKLEFAYHYTKLSLLRTCLRVKMRVNCILGNILLSKKL